MINLYTPRHLFPVLITGLLILPGCQRQDEEADVDKATVTTTTTEQAPAAVKPAAQATPVTGRVHGKVIDIIEAAGYTYVQVDTGSQKLWAAGPATPFQKGDMIAFSTGMPMKNFHSKSLDRDFDLLYFVDAFTTDKGVANNTITEPHGGLAGQSQAAVPVVGVSKAEGGQSIADIYAQKETLADKPVKVRGKVVKITPAVLGKNWIHIRDSSTGVDLTVTTGGVAEKGDIVLIEGTLGLNKDFGYGYVYDVIVEDAKVTVE